MNKVKTYAVVAGAGLVFGAGCSGGGHEAAPKAEKKVATASPAPAPRASETVSAADERYVQLAKQAERAFEADMRDGKARLQLMAGVCSLIAFHRGNDPAEGLNEVATVGSPAMLTVRDKQTGESVSVTAAYDLVTHGFIYGPVNVANKDLTSARTIAGTGDELDEIDPSQPFGGPQTDVHITADKRHIEDSAGNEVMSIGAEGNNTKGLQEYAQSEIGQLTCRAVMEGGKASANSQNA